MLRISRQVPVRALELCLECISVLLRAGWGGGLEPALSGQLLILFTFLAKPISADNGLAATSEELQAVAFQCMAELMTEASRTKQGKEAMTATANIPALGEAVLVMLDSLTDSSSNSVKLGATMALKALVAVLADDDALASFLPRIVSSLTKVLTPSSSNRPGFRVVEHSLGLLSSLLLRLLSDRETRNLPEKASPGQLETSTTVSRSISWLQATASQMKIALANVFKLRDHDKSEVRQALLQLCLCIIQDCRTSLSNCTSMAIETIISLVGHEGSQDAIETQLKALLSTDSNLSDLLRESLHGWILALPRLMQSKDDRSRRRIIHQISVTLRLFEQDLTTLDDRLADSLRDGVSTVFSDSKGLEELSGTTSDTVTNQALILGSAKSSFQPLKLRFKGQDDTIAEFKVLVQELARSDSALTVAQELTSSLDIGTLETQLASFWVSVNLIRDITTSNPSFDDFIDLGMPNRREEILDALYSHSLTILNERESSNDTPWHFYALALETIALQATRYRAEFRPELSEVLYPVLHYLGSSNDSLREHALTCLNVISEASGYSNAGQLVVANVDYIVNAVGLKLAIGDVSPQAPQVLLMMMRLCGPSLLPYLDDLVGSIFDALERYHGYPKLAELLFSVLKGMAEEGVKTPQLALTAGDADESGYTGKKPVTMKDVVEALKKMEADSRKRDKENEEWSSEPFPQKPWKDESSTTENGEQSDPAAEDQHPANTQPEEPPPPAPRTFSLLLKISELTQHYLTTTSPSLRNSLLSLLRTTIPALAKHENSFLPLINTLWPVLLPRLQDPEAYIVSNTLDVIALMCEHAGDFMRSRIEDAWDVIVRKVHRRTQNHTENRNKGGGSLTSSSLHISAIETSMTKLSMSSVSTTDLYRPELYVDAPSRMIWKSLVDLLCAIAKHVTVREERFDDILDILDPVLEVSDVRQAMEHCNADAVWLRLYRKSKRKSAGGSVDAHISAQSFTSSLKVPVGRSHWHFVRI